MNSNDEIRMLASLFAVQVPVLVICFVACVVILARWKEAPKAALWALLGFGLAALLGFVVPAAQTGLQTWIRQTGHTVEGTQAMAGLGFLWSVLRAISYLLLLIAIFSGRSTVAVGMAVTGASNQR